MRPLRVAVVGGGFGRHVLVPAFRMDHRATVELVCVSSASRAAALAQQLAVPRSSGDWRTVVSDPQIDVVAISVPPAVQAPIALAAIKGGKHVFAEKPLAMNATHAKEIVDSAAALGRIGALDFEFREIAAWRRARELIQDGVVGRLRHVYITWRVETWAHRDPRPTWKRDPAAGGGTLNLFASHSLDAVAWMVAPVARLAARLSAPAGGGAESRVDAWLDLSDGTPVSMSVAADATAATEHRLEIFGETGALRLENQSADYAAGFTLALAHRGSAWTDVELRVSPPDADGRVLAVSHVVHRFIDAIVDNTQMSPGLAEGLAVQRVIDAIREAHRTGTWQTLS